MGMSAARFTRPWALDAASPNWKTINGAHVPLDGEGELTGKGGKKIRKAEERKQHVPRPLTSTAPNMGRYWELVKAHGVLPLRVLRIGMPEPTGEMRRARGTRRQQNNSGKRCRL